MNLATDNNSGAILMKILCPNIRVMLDIVHSLVMKGLTFDANAETFVIELTGGF